MLLLTEAATFMLPKNNEAALSRRGDFRVDQDGFLVDGAGNKILNQGLQPIVLLPTDS